VLREPGPRRGQVDVLHRTPPVLCPPCSVVVPAHDEAAVIADRLGRLTGALGPDVELVVVANGCSDRTAEVARTVPGVRVVELSVASKAAALNAGDREVTRFPRIYLDADISISGDALARLADTLTTDEPVVAAPRVDFDLSRSSWPVRAFYRVFDRLPYAGRGLVGLGVYGLSESARRRFGTFPAVVADDLFVQRLFTEDERRTVDATFTVLAPRTLSSLLSVRTRVARGNGELGERAAELGIEQRSTTVGTARALVREVRRSPLLLPCALVYITVTGIARARARRAGVGSTWERDDSSRTPDVGSDVDGRAA
jgi:glycosyltransferase involved in cell wall biosynthesis